jgi:hypothetical protein
MTEQIIVPICHAERHVDERTLVNVVKTIVEIAQNEIDNSNFSFMNGKVLFKVIFIAVRGSNSNE